MKIKLLGLVLRLFSWIPARSLKTVATPLAAMLWHSSSKKRHVTRVNLQVAYPELDQQEREQIARASMLHYVLGVLEAGMLWHWPAERIMPLLDDIQGIEYIDEARRHGKGVIVAGPHWGAWELISTFAKQQFDGAILYKPSKHQNFETELLRKRVQSGVDYAATTPAGLKQTYGYLKDGRAVGFVCDQEPSHGMGRWAAFFGVPALTGVFMPRLIKRTGCKVVYTIVERRPNGRFRVHFLPAQPGTYSEDIDESLSAINRGIENCIAIDPDQYLWAYKRYRHGPDYSKGIY